MCLFERLHDIYKNNKRRRETERAGGGETEAEQEERGRWVRKRKTGREKRIRRWGDEGEGEEKEDNWVEEERG